MTSSISGGVSHLANVADVSGFVNGPTRLTRSARDTRSVPHVGVPVNRDCCIAAITDWADSGEFPIEFMCKQLGVWSRATTSGAAARLGP